MRWMLKEILKTKIPTSEVMLLQLKGMSHICFTHGFLLSFVSSLERGSHYLTFLCALSKPQG